MKLKRKLLAVITAAATVLSLCACSSESGYSNSDSGKLKIRKKIEDCGDIISAV